MNNISIVTGASGTLGSCVVEELLKRNHTVLAITRKKYRKNDNKYNEINIDLSNLKNIEENKLKILNVFKEKNFNKINIIHMAGIYEKQCLPLTLEQIDSWQKMFNVNCFSFYYIISILYDEIKKINKGNIITISSNLTERVNNNTAAYIASKSALESLTKQLAYELGKYNISCNSISPGIFLSKMNINVSEEKMEKIKINTPLNKVITEEEIKNIILLMLDSDFSWVTGQNIIADGGNTIGF